MSISAILLHYAHAVTVNPGTNAPSRNKPHILFPMPTQPLSKLGVGKIAAPIATSGDNVYVTWWSNKTGNWDVFFRASSDGGKTFGPKMNLSNDTARSEDADIGTSANNVYVTWWNTNNNNNNNQTGTREPVFRVSSDNGKTFGPVMMLDMSSNATGSTR